MEKTLAQFRQGLITEKELFDKLEKNHISGTFQIKSGNKVLHGQRQFNGVFIGFDYKNQAWIKDCKYERCGHPESMDCGCFGRDHAGQTVILSGDSNPCFNE